MIICRFAIAIVGLAICFGPAQGQVTLKWKFRPGEKFYQETVEDSTMKMVAAGRDNTQKTKHTNISSFEVVSSIEGGETVLNHKFEKVNFENAGSMAPATDLLQQLQGTSFRLTLGPSNRISKIDGFATMLNRIAGDNPQMRRMVGTLISEATMKQQVEDYFAFLPDRPVRRGDRWERKTNVPFGAGGSFDTTQKYTYLGRELLNGKPLHKIGVSLSMDYRPPGKDTQATSFIQISKGNLRGEARDGAFYFDADKGLLVEARLRVDVNGNLSASSGGQSFEMQIEQDTTTTVKFLDRMPR